MKMEALSVRDILSTQDIVIPEIQREYVWGNNKQLLEQFIRDITTAGTDINVGFLYSYMPEQASHSTCFLIDGQQRFTTLVLILYYLSIKEKRQADFNGLLKCSGTHMSFSYRVRSTTDNFLRKLFSDNTWFYRNRHRKTNKKQRMVYHHLRQRSFHPNHPKIPPNHR